eukprot:COSAG02_NODE_1433_length_12638_cov_10.941388_3_plen_55_part_00
MIEIACYEFVAWRAAKNEIAFFQGRVSRLKAYLGQAVLYSRSFIISALAFAPSR